MIVGEELQGEGNFYVNLIMNKTLIAGIVAGLFVLLICIWGWNHRTTNETVFESINVLFSGLAFAVLIITVLMQKEELELQRKELGDTRNEFIQQNETLKIQRFESTFFQLLQLQVEIIKLINFSKEGIIKQGRECFKMYYYQLEFEAFKNVNDDDITFNNFVSLELRGEEMHIQLLTLDETVNNYKTIYMEHESDLGHYYRSLYNIYRYLAEAEDITAKKNILELLEVNYLPMSWSFYFTTALRKKEKASLNTLKILRLFKI